MVHQDVPPYCIAQGARARLIGINLVGLRRNGLSKEAILAIRRAYKALFRSGKLLGEALAELEATHPCPEVQHMIDFCKNSKRGVIAAKRSMREHDDE